MTTRREVALFRFSLIAELVRQELDIALIHARPYRPQGKGKTERWFKTVRAQLLTRLSPADTASLDASSRRLHAWVEGEYHHAPHRGLSGVTPLAQWAQRGEALRFPHPGLDLEDMSLFETQRKVQKDRAVALRTEAACAAPATHTTRGSQADVSGLM